MLLMASLGFVSVELSFFLIWCSMWWFLKHIMNLNADSSCKTFFVEQKKLFKKLLVVKLFGKQFTSLF